MRDDQEQAPEPSGRVVHRAQGAYGELLVIDHAGWRHLRFGGVGGVDQTVIQRRRPGELPTVYLRVATVGFALARNLERALLVGLGGGGYARFLRRHFPRLAVDVIEIDPIVVQLAREYFGFREEARLRLFTEDAAEFVADAAADPAWRYDVVFLDAYHGQKIPTALARQAFFRRVADLRNEGGVAVANVGLPERWAEDRVIRRFASAFPGGCFELAVPDEDNRIAIATDPSLGRRRLGERLRAFDGRSELPFELAPYARERRDWS